MDFPSRFHFCLDVPRNRPFTRVPILVNGIARYIVIGAKGSSRLRKNSGARNVELWRYSPYILYHSQLICCQVNGLWGSRVHRFSEGQKTRSLSVVWHRPVTRSRSWHVLQLLVTRVSLYQGPPVKEPPALRRLSPQQKLIFILRSNNRSSKMSWIECLPHRNVRVHYSRHDVVTMFNTLIASLSHRVCNFILVILNWLAVVGQYCRWQ